MARKTTALIQFKVRMREHLRARLQRAADKRGVTLTQEIADRLEKSFEAENLQRLGEVTDRLAQQTKGLVTFGEALECQGKDPNAAPTFGARFEVPEPLGDRDDIDAGVDELAGMAVPEPVEGQLGHPDAGGKIAEIRGDGTWPQRRPFKVGE